MTDLKFISDLNYPDFVGFINQWNVLPGAYDTISKWSIYSRITEKSSLLQIGCTTGFQSRELAHLTGCKALGVDLSKYAVDSAIWNAQHYSPEAKVSYKVANAEEYIFDEKYSHIAMGAGLKFFKNPEKMLERCSSLLIEDGYILASPFFVTKEIPQNIISNSQEIFGITPTAETYKNIMMPYSKYEILFEEIKSIEKETECELKIYCQNTIDRFSLRNSITNSEILDYAYDRLKSIRRATNDLREYQKYTVLVLRYRQAVYPNRFVELF